MKCSIFHLYLGVDAVTTFIRLRQQVVAFPAPASAVDAVHIGEDLVGRARTRIGIPTPFFSNDDRQTFQTTNDILRRMDILSTIGTE